MSQETLEQQIKELQDLVERQAQPKPSLLSELKWLQTAIAIIAVIIGLGINWGITKTKLEVLSTRQEETVANYQERTKTLEEQVRELQIKQASNDQILQTIQSDIREIKDDVKKLIRGR
jgi:hypothetical protein